jgi:hypothetical protein
MNSRVATGLAFALLLLSGSRLHAEEITDSFSIFKFECDSIDAVYYTTMKGKTVRELSAASGPPIPAGSTFTVSAASVESGNAQGIEVTFSQVSGGIAPEDELPPGATTGTSTFNGRTWKWMSFIAPEEEGNPPLYIYIYSWENAAADELWEVIFARETAALSTAQKAELLKTMQTLVKIQ